MRKLVTVAVITWLSGCTSQAVEPSAGDSPVHRVKCPSFVTWKMCLAKADRKFCGGEGAQLLHPSAEELDESLTDGSTVPVEGRIRHRSIVVICEQ